MQNFAIAIHGGAGCIQRSQMTPEREKAYLNGLKQALDAGYGILEKGLSALDAVEAAVVSMENDPLFNAGRGAVFTHEGKHELDAAIMFGKTLSAGAVCCVQGVRNPVMLARAVMNNTQHILLSGAGAEAFAREMNLDFESESYFDTEERREQWLALRDTERVELDHTSDMGCIVPNPKVGTVGAVAIDKDGNVAAATSTGGMTNKKFSRVGDSPIIGAGTYASNDSCAVSCTGHGEFFIKNVVAYDVACLMKYAGLSLQEACEKVVQDKLYHQGGEGGLVAVDPKGNVALVFNSEGMYRGFRHSNGTEELGIYR